MSKHASLEYASGTVAAVVDRCGDRLRTAVDGGAFVGTWSTHLADSFARVISFEPVKENFDCLKINLGNRVEMHNLALTDVVGKMSIRPGRNSKPYGWQMFPDKSGDVQGIKLDNFHLYDLDLLKLDVEGHEFEALNGAMKTIMHCRPVVVIEEKFDKSKRATALLLSIGMTMSLRVGRDYIFVWDK